MTRVDPCYAAPTDLLRKACLPGLHPKTLRDPIRSPKARPVPLRLRWGLSRPGPVQGTFPVTKSSQYRRDSFKHGAVQHENFLWIVSGVSLGVGWGRGGKALWRCRLGQGGYGLWMPARFLRLRRTVWWRTGRVCRSRHAGLGHLCGRSLRTGGVGGAVAAPDLGLGGAGHRRDHAGHDLLPPVVSAATCRAACAGPVYIEPSGFCRVRRAVTKPRGGRKRPRHASDVPLARRGRFGRCPACGAGLSMKRCKQSLIASATLLPKVLRCHPELRRFRTHRGLGRNDTRR